MKKLLPFVLIFIFFSCEDDLSEIKNTIVFEEFWQYTNENYIYFKYKEIDWNTIKAEYATLINEDLNENDLLDIVSAMLDTLRDNHNSIDTKFSKRRRYDYTKGYDIHFDLSVIQNEYLKNNFNETGYYTYGMLENQIAYIHLSRFFQIKRISKVLSFFEDKNIKGLILDIRNNTGGTGQDAVEIVGHFIDKPTTVGYLVEKTGKAHDDVSQPLPVIASPKTPYFDIPVVLLINRQSYSASTYLASQMKDLPNVTLLGQITGGGGGGNQTQELSNGWLLSVSSSKLLDANFDESIEDGVLPDIAISNDSLTLSMGTDEMLERVLEEF